MSSMTGKGKIVKEKEKRISLSLAFVVIPVKGLK